MCDEAVVRIDRDDEAGPDHARDLNRSEQNWIPTVTGRDWFAYFRFYGLTEQYFDRSWRMPDIESVS